MKIDDENIINYGQFIPIAFLFIWIASLAYILYLDPTSIDEFNGRIYPITYKSRTLYLTLTEEILICGSAIGIAVSAAILHTIKVFWIDKKSKDNDD